MPREAQQDENQVHSLIAIGGTAGTADAAGTSLTVAVGADPSTGAMYVYNLGPAGSTSVGTPPVINGGTVASTNWLNVRLTDGTSFYNASGAGGGTSVEIVTGTVGVVSSLTNGTVRVTAATVNTGTINASTVNASTVNLGSVGGLGANAAATVGFPVLVAGMDGGGTAYTFLTDTTRRIHNVMQVGTLNAGTLNAGTVDVAVLPDLTGGTVDLVTTITTLSNLTNGSVRVTAGTITSGTVDVVSNVTNGTIRVTAGTINTGTINSGTINAGTINTGTINSGTINAGTITEQPYPASQVLPAFAIGTAAIGTLVSAAGAGTGIYINSYALTVMSGTLDMCLSFGLGSTSNQVVARGYFPPGGGVALSFDHPSFYGTANSALTYQILGGAGTASWAVTYNTKGTP